MIYHSKTIEIMKKKVYEVWVGDIYYDSFPTKIQATEYARQLFRANPKTMAYIEEDCECNSAFIDLCNALDDFVHQLTQGQDLPAGTLVMCKARESELDGWRLQYYWQKGQTLTSVESGTIHSGWLYIVPLRYFKPTSTDWRPEEKYNWAKFGEGQE